MITTDEKGRRVLSLAGIEAVCNTDPYINEQGHKCRTMCVVMAGSTVSRDGVEIGEVTSPIGGGAEVIYKNMHFYISPATLFSAVQEMVDAEQIEEIAF